jgi:hypothetical protein
MAVRDLGDRLHAAEYERDLLVRQVRQLGGVPVVGSGRPPGRPAGTGSGDFGDRRRGPPGARGPAGPAGPVGPAGPRGLRGAAGEQGPEGRSPHLVFCRPMPEGHAWPCSTASGPPAAPRTTRRPGSPGPTPSPSAPRGRP